jgi:LysM repeat protein
VPGSTAAAEPSASLEATPGSGGSTPPATPPPSTSTTTYRVKAGDTMIGIAAKFGTTPKEIAALNGITDPSSLKVGQVLKIP